MRLVLSHLDDVDHKIPIVGGTAVATLDRIERLLKASPILEAPEQVTLRAALRAIEKRAPFHKGKNSMADAVIIEMYAECLRDKTEPGVRFAFVTHNKSDFSSENENSKIPHADFTGLFTRIKSLYFINLPEALRRVEPSLVTDIMIEQSWAEEPRGLTEILEAEDLLFNQVWYNRHWNLRMGVQEGRIKIVDHENLPASTGHQGDCTARCLERCPGVGKESRTSILARKTWGPGTIRMGHDQRQTVSAQVGIRRRVGHA